MIRARPGLVVREVVPSIAVVAVILADGAPLAFAEVGAPLAPLLPRHPLLPRLIKAYLFCGFISCRLSLVRQRSPPFCIIRRYPDVVLAPCLSASLENLLQPGVWQAASYSAVFRACSRRQPLARRNRAARRSAGQPLIFHSPFDVWHQVRR